MPKAAAAGPLTPRERALQLLDRFTFGPRPGEVERVLVQGVDAWLDSQLKPEALPDAELDKRLHEYPTLTMAADQALKTFPDNGTLYAAADGRLPYPTDPQLAAVYEVQIYKVNQLRDRKGPDGKVLPRAMPSEEEKAERKKADVATAARVAGDLFALPKRQRMAALIKLPVEERAAFAANVAGDQRNLLLRDFTPREREGFLAMAAGGQPLFQIGNELAQARIVRDVLTERQLQEVMTDFWFNHFNIYLGKDADQWYAPSYERDVIRKHALGTFKDLLLATAQSPAMMVYLDNYLSIGPSSAANGVDPKRPKARRGNKGLNENYGREVMELHTVGVNGGYTQADVTSLSAILTGWGVDRANQGGAFFFDQRRHEPGDKQWFGHLIHEGRNPDGTPNGMEEGLEALAILAASPQTAHFISWKLAQRFVADDPPAALVDRLTRTYLSTGGDIRAILRAMVASPEFNSRQYFRNKVKTPVEFVVSAFRSTATDPQNPGALVNTVKQMGMPLYYALPPTGYYITADHWMNSVALVDRLNFAYQLTSDKFANQKFDSPRLLAMGLLLPTQPLSEQSAARPVSAASPPPHESVRRMQISGHAPVESQALPASPAGADIALRVLESTMIGGAVSPQTNQLIRRQMAQQPPTATATDTLNLLTALVLGSPEFQLR